MQTISYTNKLDNTAYAALQKKTISIPIAIPKSRSYDKNLYEEPPVQEYSLNCGNFKPGKMSPPDPWKSRLEQRLKEFDLKLDN